MKNLCKARTAPLFGTQRRRLCAIAAGALIVSALILAGCATTVAMESVRPPTIDTSGMQRLAVSDFENKSGVGGQLGAGVTNRLNSEVKRIIPATGKFTLVAPTDPNAEGVFTGEITVISANDTSVQKSRTDRQTGVTTPYTEYTRTVTVGFSYGVNSTRTQMPVGTVNKSGSRKSVTESAERLTDPLTLATAIIDAELKTLERDLVPTIVSMKKPLMKVDSKDKAVKQLFKTALALVKNGRLDEAVKQFDAIAGKHRSAAAGANSNIIGEAIAARAAARGELAELFSDKDEMAEKAAKGATDILRSKLPSGANIIIVKTQTPPAERGMLDYVVDQIIKTVLQEGNLAIVDRSSQELINAEQQYQLSGNVSDDSIVSIGKQLGAQYIVQCGISGSMSLRRLNVKVLSVETSAITAQEDFDI